MTSLADAWREGYLAGLQKARQVREWNRSEGRVIPDEYLNPHAPHESDPVFTPGDDGNVLPFVEAPK